MQNNLSPQQSSPDGEEYLSPFHQTPIEEDIRGASPTPGQPSAALKELTLQPVEEEPNIANLHNYENDNVLGVPPSIPETDESKTKREAQMEDNQAV